MVSKRFWVSSSPWDLTKFTVRVRISLPLFHRTAFVAPYLENPVSWRSKEQPVFIGRERAKRFRFRFHLDLTL